jgi:predicted RNase H-like HicB family nuclease
MPTHAVKVPVTASIPIECEFWSEGDGWTGSCPQLKTSVHGNNFEEAKKHMEAALQTAIESMLRSRPGGHVAA